MSPKLGTVGTT